jgi:hypothetical protein
MAHSIVGFVIDILRLGVTLQKILALPNGGPNPSLHGLLGLWVLMGALGCSFGYVSFYQKNVNSSKLLVYFYELASRFPYSFFAKAKGNTIAWFHFFKHSHSGVLFWLYPAPGFVLAPCTAQYRLSSLFKL